MIRILLVDGYNVIHAWPDLMAWMQKAGLDAARERLISRIHDYAAGEGLYAVVVFDAYSTKHRENSIEKLPGLEIVYTASGETADHYIERVADSLQGKECELYVATSDGLEQSIVLGRGAVRITPAELLTDMGRSRNERRTRNSASSPLAERLSPEVYRKLEKMRRLGEGD